MEIETRARITRILFTVGGASALVGLIILGLWLSDDGSRDRRLEKLNEVRTSFQSPKVDPAKVWITRSESEFRKLEKRNQELERRLRELERAIQGRHAGAPTPVRSETDAGDKSPTEAFMEALKRLKGEATRPDPDTQTKVVRSPVEQVRQLPPPPAPPIQKTSATTAPPPPPPAPASKPGNILGIPPARPGKNDAGILVVELADPDAGENQEPQRTAEDFLPAGSLIRATLLGGVDAPTGGLARSNPHPVLLRLEDDGILPNRFRSHVRECHITAAVYGDLPSERAYFRTERLSCVMKDGRIMERKITAYVAGEDGKTGLRGRLVEKRGQYIAKTLLAGTLGGIGKGLSQSVTQVSTSALGAVQTLDPKDIGKYGIGDGFGTALEKLADWYLKRADELYPIIEVDAGRSVDVILLVGLGLDPGVDKGGSKLATTAASRGR